MSKDLRRKQKKAKRGVNRGIGAATVRQAPQFESDLPLTQSELESEIEKLLPVVVTELPEIVESEEQARTLWFSPTMVRLLRLQKQLFRVVFGREPGDDPMFWDRKREKQGAFYMNEITTSQGLPHIPGQTVVRPEIAYAVELTGILPVKSNLGRYEEQDIERWKEAASDYAYQAETGIPPVTPETLMHAIRIASGDVDHPDVLRQTIPESIATSPNKIQFAIDAAMKNQEKAMLAVRRLEALRELVEHPEFHRLVSPGNYSMATLIAVASAEIDRETGTFVVESFRERLKWGAMAPQAWAYAENHDIA